MRNSISSTSSDDYMDCYCGECPACVQREVDYQNAQEEQEERDMLYREDRAQEIAYQRQLDGAPSDDDDDGDEEDPHGAHPIEEPDGLDETDDPEDFESDSQ